MFGDGRYLAAAAPPASGEGIYNGVNPLSQTISLFFVQATIILGLCGFLGLAGQQLRSPRVIFEIIAGIILGPSALCRNQWFKDAVFPAASINYLSLVANIGLTFYLFIIGIELDTKLLMTHARRTAGIALCGMAVPFCIGIAISKTLIDNLQSDQDTGFTSFFVFIGTAMSITAFPVLARILKEGGLIYTRCGAMTMGAAALNDAIAWCLLALAISVANGGSMTETGYIFGTMVGIAGFQLLVMKPFLEFLVEYSETHNVAWITNNLFGFVICLLFMSAWFTELIGLDVIFGAFLFGLAIPRGSRLYHNCREYIEQFVLTFTLPLYFTISGLKTDITTINTDQQGAMIVLVCFCATVGKFFGAGISAYFTGLSIRESSTIAVLMNTRGLVELIVLNVGLTAKILNTRTFSVMVIMCLFTTFITSPIVSVIYPESMRIPVSQEAQENRRKSSEAGIELAKSGAVPLSDDYDGEEMKIELHSIAKRLGIVIESLPEMQAVIGMLSYFQPFALGSEFAVTAMRFIEPSKTLHDEFLGLNSEGRLIRVDEETTDFFHAFQTLRDPAAKKPELLPITGFCKGVHIPVNAFRVEGDPIEYPAELKTISNNNECSLLCIPFRANSNFARNFFWSSLNLSSVPILLLLQVKETKLMSEPGSQVGGSDTRSRNNSLFNLPAILVNPTADLDEEYGEPQPTLFTNQQQHVLPLHRRTSLTNRFPKLQTSGLSKNQIVILLTNKFSDLISLSLISRFHENVLNSITVLLPKDHLSFHREILENLEFQQLKYKTSPTVKFEEIKSISTDYEGLYHDSCEIPYDLLVVSFIEPAPVDVTTAISQRKRTATLPNLFGDLVAEDPTDFRLQSGMPLQYVYSNLAYPSLGVIGSKIHESTHTKSSLVLVVHEPLKVQLSRGSVISSERSAPIYHPVVNDDAAADAINHETVAVIEHAESHDSVGEVKI